jgi:hypothetical protein
MGSLHGRCLLNNPAVKPRREFIYYGGNLLNVSFRRISGIDSFSIQRLVIIIAVYMSRNVAIIFIRFVTLHPLNIANVAWIRGFSLIDSVSCRRLMSFKVNTRIIALLGCIEYWLQNEFNYSGIGYHTWMEFLKWTLSLKKTLIIWVDTYIVIHVYILINQTRFFL